MRKWLNWQLHKAQIVVRRINPKESVKFAKGRFKKPIDCLEIGVYMGHGAKSILDELPVRQLWLVDPYIDPIGYHPKQTGKSNLDRTMKRLSSKRYKGRYKLFLGTSDEFFGCSYMQFDFVYIDGDHSYWQVMRDLEHAWHRTRKGGMVCGDDFGSNNVAKAVFAFVRKHRLIDRLFLTGGEFIILK